MLALMLAVVVGVTSATFFLSAFFAPKFHRKDDFLWSGFGFFYTLMLWTCAQRLTGAVLLGQGVAVILILAFAWQTLRLRGAIAQYNLDTVPTFSLVDWFQGGRKKAVKPVPAAKPTPIPEILATPPTPSPVAPAETGENEAPTENLVETPTTEPQAPSSDSVTPEPVTIPENAAVTETLDVPTSPPSPVVAPKTKPKSRLFRWLSRDKAPKPSPEPVLASDEALGLDDWEETFTEPSPTLVDEPLDSDSPAAAIPEDVTVGETVAETLAEVVEVVDTEGEERDLETLAISETPEIPDSSQPLENPPASPATVMEAVDLILEELENRESLETPDPLAEVKVVEAMEIIEETVSQSPNLEDLPTEEPTPSEAATVAPDAPDGPTSPNS